MNRPRSASRPNMRQDIRFAPRLPVGPCAGRLRRPALAAPPFANDRLRRKSRARAAAFAARAASGMVAAWQGCVHPATCVFCGAMAPRLVDSRTTGQQDERSRTSCPWEAGARPVVVSSFRPVVERARMRRGPRTENRARAGAGKQPEGYCIMRNIGGPGSNLPAPTTVP